MKRAVVLLSGGLDSTTCLAIATRRDGYEAHCISFAYGQRHADEVENARRIAKAYGAASHRVVHIDFREIGGSALTDTSLEVPKDRDEAAIGAGVPITYVPARNTVFLSLGMGLAEVVGAEAIYIGVNALDYSGYPDCRPAFIEAFQHVAEVGTAAGVEGRAPKIAAPLQFLGKAEIIRLGVSLGVDYGMTHSCYDPSPEGLACGHCDACQLRRRGFAEAGVPDPTRYAR